MRFIAALEKTNSCWYLIGRARSNGYGSIAADGKRVSGHRFAYAAFVGDIPQGMKLITCAETGPASIRLTWSWSPGLRISGGGTISESPWGTCP
ncbi:hypothetical protein [Micromonospora sp. NPDC003776]